MMFWKGLFSLILDVIYPSLLNKQMKSIVGSSYLRVNICFLSDVMAIGPPYEATAMSINS